MRCPETAVLEVEWGRVGGEEGAPVSSASVTLFRGVAAARSVDNPCQTDSTFTSKLPCTCFFPQ